MSYLQQNPINESWINDEINEEAIEYAEKFAEFLTKSDDRGVMTLTTSQLRKFFGEVKRQQMTGYNKTAFVLLKPKLAYAVGRAKKNKKSFESVFRIEDFYDVMSETINIVQSSSNHEKSFKNFTAFFEAIVAYHKKYESNN